ncbi:MAG: MATE family efflux transporter [Tannerellaceae bacterium]|nr:MATE family efflux transporter [Tannerellaceae bacterium]
MNLSVYKEHYKETIRLGIPIILGRVGIIIVGFADNMMVGHHSTTELAAASFVNNFFNLAFIFGMGFSYGLTPVIGGLFADKKEEQAGEVLKNSLVINLLVGIGLSLCMFLLLLNIGLLNQPEELLPYIIPYYTIQLFSVIFTMLFNSFKQFSDGTTDTLTPMWIILASNALNIIGNYILIFGKFGAPELGLTGAGISTLASRIFTFVLFFILFLRHSKYKNYLKGFKQGTINRLHISNLIRLGLPVGFLMGVETGSFSLSVIMMGWLGSIALAAHQIVIVITTLGFMVYYGVAAAVAIRVSAFKSRNDYPEIRLAAFSGLHIIMGMALVVMGFIFLFRNQMGFLFTQEASVIQLVSVLAFPVILYQLGDGLQILFSNALRGIADVRYMAYVALICHFGLALPIGYICGFILDWGALGIWSGYPVSLSLLGVLLWKRFNKLTIPSN